MYEVVTILFLPCQYGVWSVVKKSNLKRYNIKQQHNKTWKKNYGEWMLSQGTVYIYIIYVLYKLYIYKLYT